MRIHASSLLVLIALLVAPGCSVFEESFELDATVPGLTLASTRTSDFRAYDALEDVIRADGQAVLTTRVEFSEAARSNGIDLRPTRVALINVAEVSQPLVAADPLVALEFPQPLLLYSVDDERVVAGYNTALHLASRYDVAGLPALDHYEERWQRFMQATTADAPLVGPGPGSPARHEGIIDVGVEGVAEEAFRALTQTVRAREDVQVVARYDHSVEGGRAVLTMLLNQPIASVRLAQASQTAAIDALLRFVVFEDEAGTTRLAYIEPAYTAGRHGIAANVTSEVANLQALLSEIVVEVQALTAP